MSPVSMVLGECPTHLTSSTETLIMPQPDAKRFSPVPYATQALVMPAPEVSKAGEPLKLMVQAGRWNDPKIWQKVSAIEADPILGEFAVNPQAVRDFFAQSACPHVHPTCLVTKRPLDLHLLNHTSTVNEVAKLNKRAKQKTKEKKEESDSETESDEEGEPEAKRKKKAKAKPKAKGKGKGKKKANKDEKELAMDEDEDKKPEIVEHDFSELHRDQRAFLSTPNLIHGYTHLVTNALFYEKVTLKGAELTWPGSIFTKNGGNSLARICLKVFCCLSFVRVLIGLQTGFVLGQDRHRTASRLHCFGHQTSGD